jgi:hypothetical protein
MAGADTMTLVETVVSNVSHAIGERFGEKEEQWFESLLDAFAASVVAKVLPADEHGRAEVLTKAKAAGINIDQVLEMSPT